MKKTILVVFVLTIAMTLAACSRKIDMSKIYDEVGLAPYELSEGERDLLQSFGMDGTSQIISFKAPQEAITLKVCVYSLENGEGWTDIGNGAVSIGAEREPQEILTGTFTMQLRENYSIDFNINSSGRASYKTDEISNNSKAAASSIGFLHEFQDIEINKEIPVAIMVYDDGTSMKSFSLQDYFEPSKFDGMDLVQAVTLTFSNQTLK